MRHGLSIRYDERHDEAIATFPSTHQVMVFDGATGRCRTGSTRAPSACATPAASRSSPTASTNAVTGHWENMFVFERGTHTARCGCGISASTRSSSDTATSRRCRDRLPQHTRFYILRAWQSRSVTVEARDRI